MSRTLNRERQINSTRHEHPTNTATQATEPPPQGEPAPEKTIISAAPSPAIAEGSRSIAEAQAAKYQRRRRIRRLVVASLIIAFVFHRLKPWFSHSLSDPGPIIQTAALHRPVETPKHNRNQARERLLVKRLQGLAKNRLSANALPENPAVKLAPANTQTQQSALQALQLMDAAVAQAARVAAGTLPPEKD